MCFACVDPLTGNGAYLCLCARVVGCLGRNGKRKDHSEPLFFLSINRPWWTLTVAALVRWLINRHFNGVRQEARALFNAQMCSAVKVNRPWWTGIRFHSHLITRVNQNNLWFVVGHLDHLLLQYSSRSPIHVCPRVRCRAAALPLITGLQKGPRGRRKTRHVRDCKSMSQVSDNWAFVSWSVTHGAHSPLPLSTSR